MNQPYNPYGGQPPAYGSPAHTPQHHQQHQQYQHTVDMQQTQQGVWTPQPQGQQVQQAPQQGMMPAIHMPDDALIQQAYARAQEEQARIARIRSGQGFGGDLHWFSPLGPQGETKWGASVPIGYEASYVIWLLPAWAPGILPHVNDPSHFYRSAEKPQGTGITCAGEGQCWVCAARNALFKTGSEVDAKKAQDAGKLSKRAIYQIILLEHYQSHFTPDGRMVPWLFRVPGGLHNDIVEKIKNKTAMKIMHPQHGRPLVVRKKKKGAQTFDIDWAIDDLDPRPLDQHFWPIFQNLYDLTKFVKKPTLTEQYEAIVAMNFPVPPQLPQLVQQEQAQLAAQQAQGGQPAMGAPAGYGAPALPQNAGQPAYAPTPNAPSPSPYGAPIPPTGAPAGMPPPGQPMGSPAPQAAPGAGTYAPQPGGQGGYQVQPMPQGQQPVATTFQHGPGHTGNTAPGHIYQQPQQPVDPNLIHLQNQMRG